MIRSKCSKSFVGKKSKIKNTHTHELTVSFSEVSITHESVDCEWTVSCEATGGVFSSGTESSLIISSETVSSLNISSGAVSSLNISSWAVSSLTISSEAISSLDISSEAVSSLTTSSGAVSCLAIGAASRNRALSVASDPWVTGVVCCSWTRISSHWQWLGGQWILSSNALKYL